MPEKGQWLTAVSPLVIMAAKYSSTTMTETSTAVQDQQRVGGGASQQTGSQKSPPELLCETALRGLKKAGFAR